jgi:hypothetical protein
MKAVMATLTGAGLLAVACKGVAFIFSASCASSTGETILADSLSTAEIEARLTAILTEDRPDTTSITFRSGAITIERQVQPCEAGVDFRTRYEVHDVRALASGRGAYAINPFTPAEGATGVFVQVDFQPEVAAAIEAADRTADAHNDQARAEHGWVPAAAANGSKIVLQQHADAVALHPSAGCAVT